MPKWLTGKIIDIQDQSPTTKLFKVAIEEDEIIEYKAGQFVVMDLPIHEKRLKRWRSYSIANAPNSENILEFSIVKLEGGAGTKYLFEETKIGTELKFKKPAGIFTLPSDVSDKELVFVCTGTGVAPFRAMIFDVLKQKKAFKKIHLIFGTRTEEGILFKDEFENLATELDNFYYDVALSRSDNPAYHSGYVHAIYLEQYAKVRPEVQFYLCGWSKMIDEANFNLTEKISYDKSQVIYELYG